MSLVQFGLVTLVGIVAGIVNTLAGGGSLLTLPLLIFLGLPSTLANGTNRIAVLVQNITAVLGFRSKGFRSIGYGLFLAVPATIGTIVGAWAAIDISDTAFRKILGILMLIILALILWNPAKKRKNAGEDLSPTKRWLAAFFFLFVGFYGGFIQAGVGIFIIVTLTFVNGLDLVKTNSYKVVINSIFTLIALMVFAWYGQVDWIIGLLLAIGMGIGGWVGSHLAVTKGEPLIRIVLAVSVIAMSMKLLFDFSF